jgi:hypothetical protein
MSSHEQFVPLYIRGAVIQVAKGTTMHMAPLDTSLEQMVKVEVQGVSFLISRGMVLQTRESKHAIPMQDNYFAKALLNQPEQATITIPEAANGEAKFYPVIFDFLSRRLQCVQAPLHEYIMGTNDAIRLHKLVNALFVVNADNMLPTQGKYTYVATMPDKHSGDRHDISTAMCVDPRFVRLVREVQDADRKMDTDSKNARRNMLKQLKMDHDLQNFPYATLRNSTVHAIERGSLFAIHVDDSMYNDDTVISVVYDSINYECA